MNKKITAVLVTVLILVSFVVVGVSAESEAIVVEIDGNLVDFPDAKPFINSDSRTLCPIRFIAQNLGADVKWIDETRTVVITYESTVIKLAIGENTALVNDEVKTFDTRAQIFEDRTYVPLRFVSETLDRKVGWDDKTKRVKISRRDTGDLIKEQEALSAEEEELAGKLDEYLEALESNRNFHGAVLVAKDGKILLDEGYGNADYEQGISNTPKTTFPIGSVTKQFTALAIMQLYEDGALDLEDKLSKYIPDVTGADTITLKHLLTHSSGIANYTDLPAFLTMKTEDKSVENLIGMFKELPLEFDPGTKWKYSNSGYLLLGDIVEKVSGLSLDKYLDKNIFKPLDMKNTGVSYKDTKKMYDAKGYAGFLDITPADDELLLRGAYGAGYLYSTVEDLYRWDRALYTEDLVKKETIDEIFTGYLDTQALGMYGYGWFIKDDEDLGKVVYHGGNTLTFTANIARYIDSDLAIIMTINNGYYDVNTLTGTLAGIVKGNEYELPGELKAIQLDTEVIEKYVGTYEYIPGFEIIITRSGDQLYSQLTGQQKAEIYPLTENKFFYRAVEAQIAFETAESGEVTGLLFEQLGTKIAAKRIGDAPEEEQEAEVDTKIYESYAGEYELMPGFIITISTDGEHLYAQATGQAKLEVFPKSETEFFYKAVEAEIVFVKNDEGEVAALTLIQSGQNLEAKKIK